MAPERSPPQLAIEIQRLPAWGGKLMLGLGLSGLSTEGDFGRDTLQTVATTLAGAIQEQRQGAAAKGGKGLGDAYSELARLVHYEHVQVSLEDPEFAAALSKMDADDKVRQDADFTLQDLEGKQWTLKQLGGAGELLGHVVPFVPQGDAGSGKAIPRFSAQGLVILAISDEDADKVNRISRRGTTPTRSCWTWAESSTSGFASRGFRRVSFTAALAN